MSHKTKYIDVYKKYKEIGGYIIMVKNVKNIKIL